MQVLRARLLARKREQELAQLSQERNSQIGAAMRAEKIKTYNFPQNRLTDHRIKKSWHSLEKIIDGDLEPVIKTFKKLNIKKINIK